MGGPGFAARSCMIGLVVAACGAVGDRDEAAPPTSMAGRSPVYAPQGMVASSSPLAAAAGLDVLMKGGNAVDAAVTAAAVLNVVEPMMTGIGGDLFALVWPAGEPQPIALNGTGRAGVRMTREAFLERGHAAMPPEGAESITVPGALAGWAALLERHGTITLADALEPAIRLAEGGFPVPPVIAWWWQTAAEKLAADEGGRRTFLVDEARPPVAGEWFRNPDLAETLRLIAAEGPSVLYGGMLGRRVVEHVDGLGGWLTLEDLASHESEWLEPISVDFRGHRVWQHPPNSQGIAALEMLRILDGYDLERMGSNSATYLHHLIEAKKLSFADLRRYVTDPEHMAVSPAVLLSDGAIRDRRSRLHPQRAAAAAEPFPLPAGGETTYVTTADAEGTMVSLINSIYLAFGSGVVVPGTGFALQNRASGFTLEPGHGNTVAPGKRPFHTNMPAMVSRAAGNGSNGSAERPWLSFGVVGGPVQPQGQVQVLLNLIVFGMNLQEAIDHARVVHRDGDGGGGVALEPPIRSDVRNELRRKGHVILDEGAVAFFGGAQAVMRLERGWIGGSDPRMDGHAVGY